MLMNQKQLVLLILHKDEIIRTHCWVGVVGGKKK